MEWFDGVRDKKNKTLKIRVTLTHIYPTYIRVRPFFTFFQLFTLFDEGTVKMAQPILTYDTSINTIWQELDPFLEIKNFGQDFDLKEVKFRHFMRPSKFWPEFSRKWYEIERKCHKKLDRKSCMGFRMAEIFLISDVL